VIGCGALHINWSDLAEIKSLAVSEEHQRKGVGAMLVRACLDEARDLGIPTVFCLTYKPDFSKVLVFLLLIRMNFLVKSGGNVTDVLNSPTVMR